MFDSFLETLGFVSNSFERFWVKKLFFETLGSLFWQKLTKKWSILTNFFPLEILWENHFFGKFFHFFFTFLLLFQGCSQWLLWLFGVTLDFFWMFFSAFFGKIFFLPKFLVGKSSLNWGLGTLFFHFFSIFYLLFQSCFQSLLSLFEVRLDFFESFSSGFLDILLFHLTGGG